MILVKGFLCDRVLWWRNFVEEVQTAAFQSFFLKGKGRVHTLHTCRGVVKYRRREFGTFIFNIKNEIFAKLGGDVLATLPWEISCLGVNMISELAASIYRKLSQGLSKGERGMEGKTLGWNETVRFAFAQNFSQVNFAKIADENIRKLMVVEMPA